MSGTMGNPLKAIEAAVPERIKEARAERDTLVGRVLELSTEIARLETVQLVGGEVAGPVLQGLEEGSERVRRRGTRVEHQPPGPPPVADSPTG